MYISRVWQSFKRSQLGSNSGVHQIGLERYIADWFSNIPTMHVPKHLAFVFCTWVSSFFSKEVCVSFAAFRCLLSLDSPVFARVWPWHAFSMVFESLADFWTYLAFYLLGNHFLDSRLSGPLFPVSKEVALKQCKRRLNLTLLQGRSMDGSSR